MSTNITLKPKTARALRVENARLARGKGNPHYDLRDEMKRKRDERQALRSPLARAIDHLAARVTESILRCATGGRKRKAGVSRVLSTWKDGNGKLQRACFAKVDARPGKTYDHARAELTIEARSAIGARIAARPCLGCALIMRQALPKEEIRAVFADTQKILRRMARSKGNVVLETITLTPKECQVNQAMAGEVEARAEKETRARFARLMLVLRALHAWRKSAGKNASKGYDHARGLVRAVLNGEKVGKGYAESYDALRAKVETGLTLLGWEAESAARFMPASLPKTGGRLAVATV